MHSFQSPHDQGAPTEEKKWHSFLQAPFVNSVPVSRNIARRAPEQLSQYYLAGKH